MFFLVRKIMDSLAEVFRGLLLLSMMVRMVS